MIALCGEGGAYGSHVVVRETDAVRKPDSMRFEEAAALPIAGLTAIWCLERLAHLGPGQSVLIHGAAGGVGVIAVQVAQAAGAEVYATVGKAAKREYVERELCVPASHILGSRSVEFADRIIEMTGGRGVDVVLNSLAGDEFIGAKHGNARARWMLY